jgi:hypothetical protein
MWVTSSPHGVLSALPCRRLGACSLEPHAEAGGRRVGERPEEFDGKPLPLERARQPGGTSDVSHNRRMFLGCEGAVGEGGEFTGCGSPHRSMMGSVAWSAGPWSRTSLTSATSRTGIGVAIPQLPETSRNGGKRIDVPERVTICSRKRPLR